MPSAAATAPHCEEVKSIGQHQRRFTPEEELAVVADYRDGGTVNFLATKYGCHGTTVGRILESHDVDLTCASIARETVDEIVRLHESGLSMESVAQSVGASAKTVFNYLPSRGVPTRTAHQARRKPCVESVGLRLRSISHERGPANPLRVAGAEVNCHAHCFANVFDHTTSRNDQCSSVFNLGATGFCLSRILSEREFRPQRVTDRQEGHSSFDKLHAVAVNAHGCAADIGHAHSDDLGTMEALAPASRQVLWNAAAFNTAHCSSGSP